MSALYIAPVSQDVCISTVLFSFAAGLSAPCIFVPRATRAIRRHFVRLNIQAGSAPIRVVRVVRVHIARRVDDPSIVRVVAIGGTQTAILRL